MTAIATPLRTLAPVAERLGFRPAPPRTRRWWDVALVVWMAWIFDAVNNLDAVRQQLAERDGASVLGVERSLHLAPELALNTWLAAHHVLSEVVVFWYVNAHGAVTFAVFGWLWWRRPDLLPPLRTALFVTTPIALAAFWTLPVAPPRMLITGHYVDLVAAVHHVPVWQQGGTALDANQLAALPSLHIAWAVWAAVALWRMTSRRWLRVLAAAYPFVTLYAVMATGNHYLADGLVGALITGLAVLAGDRWWTWRRARAAASPVF
jgi:PAP2 superfamily